MNFFRIKRIKKYKNKKKNKIPFFLTKNIKKNKTYKLKPYQNQYKTQ